MILFYITIGLVSGIVSGMGIGGGTILIPSLIFLAGVNQHTAQGTNLLYFIPTAIIALIVHMRSKNIRKDLLINLIISGVIGALIGSYFANNIDSIILRKAFGGFLLVMGLLEITKTWSKKCKSN